jgi:carbon-monoxide dehydrogenase large subunit
MSAYVGQPLPRLEDEPFITGKAHYTADLDLPGEAHALVLRAPHAHAEIAGIDLAAAQSVPGVLGIYLSADLQAAGIKAIPSLTRTAPFDLKNADGSPMADGSQYPLAQGRVRYVGEPVALVVAETLATARDAAEAIEVDYRPLPAVTEADAALADDAPLLWPETGTNRSFLWQAGDQAAVAARLQGAAHVVELEVDYPREIVAFMEPRAALASYDPATERYTLRVGTQSAHQLRAMLTRILDLGEEHIRVIVPEVLLVAGLAGRVYYGSYHLCGRPRARTR